MTMPFRFGVQAYAPETAAAWREQARRAEDLGYSTFSVADHLLGPGPALKPTNHPVQTVAAIPAMAVAAEATSTIRIGCLVLCCDYRNPAMLAKELATLDFFAGGRLEIGLGAGWLANEYEAIGIPFRPAGERIDRLEETVGLVRAFASGEMLDIDGTHVHAVGFEGVPAFVQPPRIVVGGGSPRILRLAGRVADIVSLNFDNSAGRLGPEAFGSGLAEGTAQKVAWGREGAGAREVELGISAYFTFVTPDGPGLVSMLAPRFGMSPDQLAGHGHALIGSVDEICDVLVERRERLGISYVTVQGAVMDDFAPVVSRLAGS
jgi:probable F420-dependent oxidoreductase